MSTNAYPIRYLDAPGGHKVYVLGRPRDGCVQVRNARTRTSFETQLERLHKALPDVTPAC